MCVPAIGAVAGIASSVVGLMGAKQQADGQRAQAESAAQVKEYNAKVAAINARSEIWKGWDEIDKIRDDYRTAFGQDVVTAAASGVDAGYGSAANVIFANQKEGIEEQNNAYTNMENRRYTWLNQKTQFEHEAAAERQAGQIMAEGTFLSGIGGAIGGIGSGLGKLAGSGGSLFINTAKA